jgi:serine/threonine protein kinase
LSVTVGKYKLLRRLAVGGMAEIFLARVHGEAGFHRKVIIKKILPHYAGEPEFVRRLVDEGLLASRLSHGNIVQVLDLGRLGPDYFIAMEFVDGVDLRDLLSTAYDREAVVPVDIGIHVLWQVARALAYAHDKKSASGESLDIVHRDISPANVFVSWEGAVKLGDFGIAKARQRLSRHTMTGVLQGKFPYMSPEQTEGTELTQASDIFSFGTVAYELLTQHRPFEGESDMMILARVKEANPRPIRELRPELPESFAEVINNCLDKDLSVRFSRGAELERALATVMQENGWVVSESDTARFLSDLYGESRQPEARREIPLEEEPGEVLEASPLDPYDLKAGLPAPPPRPATPPPAQEFTRAVAQPDWHRRRRRRYRGWLAWALVMAAAAIFLVLDYTTLHLLLHPPMEVTPTSTLPEESTESPLGSARGPDALQLPDLVASNDVMATPLPIPPDISQPHEVDTRRDTLAQVDVLAATATIDLQTLPGDLQDALSATDAATPEKSAEEDTRQAPEPARSSTRLSVFPPDAEVYQNDRLLGAGPQVLSFVEGTSAQEIRVEMEGFESTIFKLRHPAPRALSKRLRRLETGRFYLRYNPASAAVFIDGNSVVSSDGLNIIDRQLTVGSHTIIVREGEQETTKTITIEKDREWRGTITATP